MNPFRLPERVFLLPAFGALALFLLFIGVKWIRYGSETASIGFGCVSEQACFSRENRGVLPEKTLVFRSGGYDGQFFFYMGAALFQKKQVVLDASGLRWSRVGYSLLTGWAALWSPMAQVRAMWIVPLLLHLCALYILFDFYRRRDYLQYLEVKTALWVFALNPFSLFSFSLSLADGPALSLLVSGLAFVYHEPEARARSPVLGGGLIALALLSKETMLFLPAGFMGAALILPVWNPGRWSKNLRELLFWSTPLLVLMLWWLWIDFSPLFAAERGGAPFVGLSLYLADPDALVSPRGLLLFFLGLFLILFVRLLYSGVKSGDDGTRRRDGLALSGGLFLVLTLISFATASEYWMNFANVGRLFTPGILIMAFAPLVLRRTRFVRILAWTGLGLCLLLDLVLMERAITGKLLDAVFVYK